MVPALPAWYGEVRNVYNEVLNDTFVTVGTKELELLSTLGHNGNNKDCRIMAVHPVPSASLVLLRKYSHKAPWHVDTILSIVWGRREPTAQRSQSRQLPTPPVLPWGTQLSTSL